MCDPSRSNARSRAGRQPRWGVLYGATLPQLGALVAVEVASPPRPLLTAARCLLAAGTLLAVVLWLRASRVALDLVDWCDCASEAVTIRVIGSGRPLAEIPAAEPGVPNPTEEHETVPAGR
jgi:hypothetical protein